jgi:hypothetical protein
MKRSADRQFGFYGVVARCSVGPISGRPSFNRVVLYPCDYDTVEA